MDKIKNETENKSSLKKKFGVFSGRITKATGSPTAFFIALLIVVLWAVTGQVFNYSENWQLVINTGTTIITFLMISFFSILKIKIHLHFI